MEWRGFPGFASFAACLRVLRG